MEAKIQLDLEETLRGIVASEVERLVLGSRNERGWLDVGGAADYLATTPSAIRALVKRRQVPFHKTPQGRVLFASQELDQYVRGQAA